MNRFRLFLFCTACLLPHFGYSDLPSLSQPLDIQLESPRFSNGVLTTEKGGVIKGKDLFIQARNIRYTKKVENGINVHKIEGSGDLFMLFKKRPYKGERVEINLESGKATVWNGSTEVAEWYLGGRVIELQADGQAIFHDAYVTTSENESNDWSIEAARVTVAPGDKLTTENVRFYFVRLPLFWLPYYSMNLANEDSGPIHYRIRWGKGDGIRIGASYNFSSFSNWKHKLTLDYNFKKGLGGGLTANYKNDDSKQSFQSLWYIAQRKDAPGAAPQPFVPRYRLQGHYLQSWDISDVHFRAMYDKLSDPEMKNDFSDHTINDAVTGRTQAKLWKRDPNWIGSLQAEARVNNFQNVKQQLPLFTFNARPQVLGKSGVIIENKFSTGYLNYVFAYQTPNVHNYESTRSELTQNIYRSFLLSPLSITPRLGYHVIHYNRSPSQQPRLQAFAMGGVDIKTRLVGSAGSHFQIIEPYLSYDAVGTTNVQPANHYVFDLQDGWAKINALRFGIRQHLMLTPNSQSFSRQLLFDLYGRAFYDQNKYNTRVPKAYFDTTINATPWQSYTLSTAWDRDHQVLDHLNILGRFTLSNTMAINLEWRKRSSFDFRKIDRENFMIEMARSQNTLRHSEMSDQRQILRGAFFWQLCDNLDFEADIRHGWGRKNSPNYTEYELVLGTLVRGALRVKFTFEKRFNDLRWYFSWELGQGRPSKITAFKKIGYGTYDM